MLIQGAFPSLEVSPPLYATVSSAANYKSLLFSPEWYLQAMARSCYFMQVLNIMHRAKTIVRKIAGGYSYSF